MKCPICEKGILKKGKITEHMFGVFLGEFPAEICSKCGEIYNLITNPPIGEKCKCGGELFQREDDKPKAIKKRLEWQSKMLEPLIAEYKKRKVLVKVNGEAEILDIFKEIKSAIKK